MTTFDPLDEQDRAAALRVKQLSASEQFHALTQYTKAFDLFKMMGVSSKELVHSNVIAALLNDRESHGLGASLRDDYLRSLASCKVASGSIPVAREVFESAVGERAKVSRELDHIDIVLAFPTRGLVIGIENKTWATDQPKQVANYQQALCDLYPNYAHRLVVYLSPTGRESPTTDDEHQTPVYYQSYGQLAALIRQQRAHAQPALAYFLDQLTAHIEKTMSGNTELKAQCWKIFEENEEAYEHLVKHYDHCQWQKLEKRFSYLESLLLKSHMFEPWAGKLDIKHNRRSEREKRLYDLDLRVEGWPEGVWIKIYKHSWFGVFPYFHDNDLESVATRLPQYAAPARAVPDWQNLYLASRGFLIKEDRCILDLGNQTTETHLNQALELVLDCMKEIDATLGIARG